MKRLILGLFTISSLLVGASNISAQTFTMSHGDTMSATYYGPSAIDVHNDVINHSTLDLVIKWKVVDENFSSDPTWVSNQNTVNICDNYLCQTNNNNTLLNGLESTATYKASTISGNDSMDAFHASFQLAGVNPGTHFIKVNLRDYGGTDQKNITFIVSKWTTGVTTVTKSTDDVTLYPNPATDDLNVLFDVNKDIKNIAVYNVIGKTMSVYRVNGSSAKMDVSKLPGGVYFIRLSDSKGQVVGTKRFTKQ